MASNRPLPQDITVTGWDQASAVKWMQNVTDLLNEIQADHTTTKATVDANRTAVLELKADHDTNQTLLTDIKTLVNNIRTHLTGDRLFAGDPALVIDTNFDVKVGANPVFVSIDGSLATVAAAASCDTGTAATFAATTWGVFNVTSDASGNLTATWATNAGAGYASEALAIAALPAAPASEASIGYVTVQAHASNTFTAGTDALATGTGGNVAAATNYYTVVDPLGVITAAVSTSAEAALTAADPAAGPAALSNSTAITLLRS